jgi:general stress protein 26
MRAAALALLTAAGVATPQPEPEVLAAAREVIARAGLCSLVTLDEAGAPQARAMDPFPPEADFTLWLGTHRSTRKVSQIRRDPRVAVHWLDAAGPGQVTLIGTAEVVEDAGERARHFKPEWAAFYSDEWRGGDYLLIRVRPLRLEVMSIPAGIASDPKGWAPAVVELGGSAASSPAPPH